MTRDKQVLVVRVTPAQVDAARAVVEWRESTGRPVSSALRKIAEARPAREERDSGDGTHD